MVMVTIDKRCIYCGRQLEVIPSYYSGGWYYACPNKCKMPQIRYSDKCKENFTLEGR